MNKQPATPKSLELGSLVTELRGLIYSARNTAATTINTLQILTNYEIGQRIVEHEQQGAGKISQKPSGQFQVEKILQKPSAKSPFTLSWSHYVLLLTIKNPEERSFYEIEATNEGWSTG